MLHLRGRMSGAVMLLLGIFLLGGVSQAADDDLAKDVRKLADAVEKKSANAKSDIDALAKKHDNEAIMDLFKLRKKGGLGFGSKPGNGPDGIELKIRALDKKPMTSKQIADEAADLVTTAAIIQAIGEIIDGKVPPKEKKKEKDWKNYNDEMKKSAQDLIAAVKGDKEPDPAKVQKAAKRLNNACVACHNDFR